MTFFDPEFGTVKGVDLDAIGGLQPNVFNFACVGLRRRKARGIAGRKVDELLFKGPQADVSQQDSRREQR